MFTVQHTQLWPTVFPGQLSSAPSCAATPSPAHCQHGFDEARIFMEQTFDDAIERCRQMAVPGDSVLLSPACASWGMFDNYEQRGDIFREKVKQMEAQANA